jgi:hypothetical protein
MVLHMKYTYEILRYLLIAVLELSKAYLLIAIFVVNSDVAVGS